MIFFTMFTLDLFLTKHLYNIYATSAQRLQRWSNIVYI